MYAKALRQLARGVAEMRFNQVGIDPLAQHATGSRLFRGHQPADRLDGHQPPATQFERLQLPVRYHCIDRRAAEAERPRPVIDRHRQKFHFHHSIESPAKRQRIRRRLWAFGIVVGRERWKGR